MTPTPRQSSSDSAAGSADARSGHTAAGGSADARSGPTAAGASADARSGHTAAGASADARSGHTAAGGSADAPAGHPSARAPSSGDVFSEVAWMASAFWASRERNRLLMLAAALVAVIGATAYMQIRLNAWNQPFYDALTRKDTSGVVGQLIVFVELAAVLLVLNVGQVWLNQMSRVVLRQGLGHDLLNEWLKPLRAFRLRDAGLIGQNPDQRLHADAQHLTELVTDLGIGLLQSTLLLLSFVGVLWVLSRGMTLPFFEGRIHVPGYMVWCALLYASTASFLSWRVGRPLIRLDAERYAREADLRFSLVRVNEEIEGITIYGGEADEKQHLYGQLESVLDASRRIVGALARLTWITAGYGWFTIVAPILVAAPSYLNGEMSFGELMMVVGAFNQVQTSLRWFVDNFSSIADWRATLLRVAGFRAALANMDTLGEADSRITIEESGNSTLRMDDLRVASPAGAIRLSEKHLEVKPGERLLIAGERGAERTLVFRAMIGLWPWGVGHITRPPRQAMMFLPARAYVPPGTLRDALCYPCSTAEFTEAAIAHALAAVGLERLQPQLDAVGRWDRQLSDDEKQCLAVARVMLQKPQWMVLNGLFDVLDAASRRRIETLLTRELAGLGVVDVGKEKGLEKFFTRRVDLLIDAGGPSFSPAQRLATAGLQVE